MYNKIGSGRVENPEPDKNVSSNIIEEKEKSYSSISFDAPQY
jgi:hypothetical protein